jgi:hypothetical protein
VTREVERSVEVRSDYGREWAKSVAVSARVDLLMRTPGAVLDGMVAAANQRNLSPSQVAAAVEAGHLLVDHEDDE